MKRPTLAHLAGTIPTRPCADCAKPVRAKYARYCSDCRWKHRIKHGVYRWRPEFDELLRREYRPGARGAATAIAKRLRMPPWKVANRAAALGLAASAKDTRRPWTDAEESTLFTLAGVRSPEFIARKLKRTTTSVVSKLKREHIRRGRRDGYTMRELELCFGVDHRVISAWIVRGWLPDRRRGYEGRDPLAITDADLLRFITEHPTDFRLDRVDQRWFMDLVLDGALVRKALAAAVEGDDAERAA